MAPEYTINVERCGVEALGHSRDFLRHHEQKHRIGIDKATYQPWAGDTVDLRPAACYPDGAALVVPRRQLIGANEDFVGFSPRFKAAFERLGSDALLPQPCGSPFAQLLSALADDNDALAPILRRPTADGTMIPPSRTWQ